MFITRLKLKNWRNFRDADVNLREYTYILGANASGKSNFLDVFRFLKDVSKAQGGGLQKAISDRGGISKLRCLHARRTPEVRIEIHLSPEIDSSNDEWVYSLAFKPEGRGSHRTLISEEKVSRNGVSILNRPDPGDKSDNERLTQTHLEQIQTNSNFRQIATFFSESTYLHIVPQLLKYADRIGGNHLEDDPFGQDFLRALATTPEKTRSSRLHRIETALALAVPHFKELKFEKDEVGRPHLAARYEHHRPKAGWQNEDQFSDGTLRLIGMLWSLLDSSSLLLLEEPELSLNGAIIEQIPMIMRRAQRAAKRRRQVVITTHSEKLLMNRGIDARGVILLEPGSDGSTVRTLLPREMRAIERGLSVAEVALPKTKPENADQLSLW